MRLIGSVDTEKQAYSFYSFLLANNIHSTYEKGYDDELKKNVVLVWIYEEDQIEKALAFLKEFKQNPTDPKFKEIDFPVLPPLPPDRIATPTEEKIPPRKGPQPPAWRLKVQFHAPKLKSHPLTFFIIIVCALLFFWNAAEQVGILKADGVLGLKIGFTKVQQELMFDYPVYNQTIDTLLQKYPLKSFEDIKSLPPDEYEQFKEAESIPTWRGWVPLLVQKYKKSSNSAAFDGTLFQKIKEGEVWRLFTPALLHGGFLHILFNMAWAFILIRQLEERLNIFKSVLLILILGILSNIAQYFMTGPYFLGFSGVIVGLVGFIWTRQRVAPWEGYPLEKTTIIFILIFIAAMFFLELFSVINALFSNKALSTNIGNTAHIVGGIFGLILGRIPFFSRRMK